MTTTAEEAGAFEVVADRLMELGAHELAKVVRSAFARAWVDDALRRLEDSDGRFGLGEDWVACITCGVPEEEALHDASCSWAAFRRSYQPQYQEWEINEAWRQANISEARRKGGRASAAKRALQHGIK